ncbi:hypothetical protein Tco_0866114 [Tanacetum coccineum]
MIVDDRFVILATDGVSFVSYVKNVVAVVVGGGIGVWVGLVVATMVNGDGGLVDEKEEDEWRLGLLYTSGCIKPYQKHSSEGKSGEEVIIPAD